jgi:hypothetical protein
MPGCNSLRVMVVEPDKEPYEKVLRGDLESMQEVVGGHIETTRDNLLPGMVLVVNKEGKIKGLPYNRCTHCDIICGTFFVCRNGPDDFRNLHNKDIEEIKLVYGLPKGDKATPSVSEADSSLEEGADNKELKEI